MAITFTLVFVVWRRQAIVKELKLKKYDYPTKSLLPLGFNIKFHLVSNSKNPGFVSGGGFFNFYSAVRATSKLEILFPIYGYGTA